MGAALPELPERTPNRRIFNWSREGRCSSETASNFAFVLMCGTPRIEMSAQGQEAQLVGALEQVFIRQLGGLGHHDSDILQERPTGTSEPV